MYRLHHARRRPLFAVGRPEIRRRVKTYYTHARWNIRKSRRRRRRPTVSLTNFAPRGRVYIIMVFIFFFFPNADNGTSVAARDRYNARHFTRIRRYTRIRV